MENLIVDTNCFLHNLQKLQYISTNKNIYTTKGVMSEILDFTKKQEIKLNFPNIKILEPTKKNFVRVLKFSKKTGDSISLSKIDISVIALALDIITEENQISLIKKNPKKSKTKIGGKKSKKNQEMLGWGGDFNSDDENGWVTPSNISNLKNETEEINSEKEKCNTKIITTDFAMQNVIMQMNIPLLNLDGKIITKLKTFILECFSCWEIIKKPNIVFCPSCGKNTVLKVTCEYKKNGDLILYRKKNKQIRVRGAKYSIPKPKGGRKINDLLLYEDDYLKPKVKSYIKKMTAERNREQKKVMEDFDFGFGYEDERKSNKKYMDVKIGYGGKNPNVNSFWKGKGKKK